MRYTTSLPKLINEIKEKLGKDLTFTSNLYKASLIDKRPSQNEEIIKLIKPEQFDIIKEVCKREKGYKVKSHYNNEGEVPLISATNRYEEIIAKFLARQKFFDGIEFEIIDYQIPIKNEKSEETKGQGKIDILGKKDNTFYLIELKNSNSSESFLRAMLEIVTYTKLINKESLANSYDIEGKIIVKPVIMIFEGTQPHIDYKTDVIQGLLKRFKEKELEIEVYYVSLNACNIKYEGCITDKECFSSVRATTKDRIKYGSLMFNKINKNLKTL